MSLYRHPEVYATVLFPEPDLWSDLQDWVELYLEGPLQSVLDPACGPATWLLPFALKGVTVAGNDLEPLMVAEAQRRLTGYRAELRVGDMTDLDLQTGPFDLALNLHGTIGHLGDDAAVVRHLRAVHRHLRPGGLYLLGMMVSDGQEIGEEPEVIYRSDPLPVPSGGTAAVFYESVRRDPGARRERIRLLLLTKGVRSCPEVLREEYDLRTFPAALLPLLLEAGGPFEVLAVHAMEEEQRPEVGLHPDCGDVTLVLRKPASAAAL